jgi:MFS family permease
MLLKALIASNFYKYFPPKYAYLGLIFIFEGRNVSMGCGSLSITIVVGSVLCAVAPTSPVFITGRAIAGIGAAGLLQGAFSILSKVLLVF